MDSLYLGNIRFQWEMLLDGRIYNFFQAFILEGLNPNRKSGSTEGK